MKPFNLAVAVFCFGMGYFSCINFLVNDNLFALVPIVINFGLAGLNVYLGLQEVSK